MPRGAGRMKRESLPGSKPAESQAIPQAGETWHVTYVGQDALDVEFTIDRVRDGRAYGRTRDGEDAAVSVEWLRQHGRLVSPSPTPNTKED